MQRISESVGVKQFVVANGFFYLHDEPQAVDVKGAFADEKKAENKTKEKN